MERRRYSRQGMSACPACKRYIRLAPRWRDTICPFCQTPYTTRTKARVLPGRGGLLAAGMLSLTAGCIERKPTADPDRDATTIDGAIDQQVRDIGQDLEQPRDATPRPDVRLPDAAPPVLDATPPDALPPDMMMQPAPEPDVSADYGVPDPPIEVDMAVPDMAPDIMMDPQPAPEPDSGDDYGVPDIPEEPAPDAGMAPDMMMDPQPAPEPDSSGDYGLPDIPDEEEPGAQAPSADGLQFARAHEAGIMPESGAPPVRPAGGVVEPTDDKTSS